VAGPIDVRRRRVLHDFSLHDAGSEGSDLLDLQLDDIAAFDGRVNIEWEGNHVARENDVVGGKRLDRVLEPGTKAGGGGAGELLVY